MVTIAYSTRTENPKYRAYLRTLINKNSEIIEVVNSGDMALTATYNEVLKNSKNDIVILIHDDLELEMGFDKKIFNYFSNSDYGILGVAGTTKLRESGIWWENSSDEVNFMGQVWHQQKHQTDDGREVLTKKYKSKYSDSFPKDILPAVCVDGLFIAVHNGRITNEFNETIPHFHFYDISFCVENFVNDVKIGVITDLNIFHRSIGELKEQWHLNRQIFLEQYGDKLPLEIVPEIKIPTQSIILKYEPTLAIIILSKNNFEYLDGCINSIKEKTAYSNYNVYIGDTGSDPEIIGKISEELVNDQVKLIELGTYNFSQNNNDIVKSHLNGEDLLLFCNDDIELINDSISQMVAFYTKNKKTKNIGTLGAKLYYKNNRIQHGGVYLTVNERGMQIGHIGIYSYFGKNDDTIEVVGNTGAFMMIERNLFESIGGFSYTENCFEDVILNLNCILRNKHNYIIGNAKNYHYESISRKRTGEYNERIKNDMEKYLGPFVKQHINRLKL